LLILATVVFAFSGFVMLWRGEWRWILTKKSYSVL
jgi:hypothetical protein